MIRPVPSARPKPSRPPGCSPEGLQLGGQLTVEDSGPSWAHPVVVGGRLYLRYHANLYCFEVKRPG